MKPVCAWTTSVSIMKAQRPEKKEAIESWDTASLCKACSSVMARYNTAACRERQRMQRIGEEMQERKLLCS